MCRFVAYRGRPVPLARVISSADHSLVRQSYQPREMTAGTLNADGFGVGWYDRSVEAEPGIYTSVLPIWNDRNLPSLSRHIVADCILANVRSATPGYGIDQSNCQPFRHGRVAFMHNGYIQHARDGLLRTVRTNLRDAYERSIRGSTDSEHVFALLLDVLHGRELTPRASVSALRQTVAQLLAWHRRGHMALNLVVSDGDRVAALRFATEAPAPSLYYACDEPEFPGAVVVASEKLSDDPAWRTVPEGGIVTFRSTADLRVDALELPEAA